MNESNNKDTKILKTLAYRLSELRKAKGKTLEEASKDLGISFSSLGSYETAIRKPDPDKLFLLADYYKVSIDYLLGRTPDVLVVQEYKEDFDVKNFQDLYRAKKGRCKNAKRVYETDDVIGIAINELMCGVGKTGYGTVKMNRFVSFDEIEKLLSDFENAEIPKPQIMLEIKNKANDIMIVEINSYHDEDIPFDAKDRLILYTAKLSQNHNVFGLAISVDKDENCYLLDAIYSKKGENSYINLRLPKTVLTAGEYLDVMSRI